MSERTEIPRRRCLVHRLVILLAASLSACVSPAPLPDAPGLAERDLLPPAELAAADLNTPAVGDILALDPPMRDFLERHVDPRARASDRLRQLLGGMLEEGYLSLDYAHQVTQTATQTFASKQGNCLSFTNLFIALAREVGLAAEFQLVDVPPRWHRVGDLAVLDRHINALIPDLRISGLETRDYVVDFNINDYRGNYPRRRITDAQAISLMYINLAVQAMQHDQRRQAWSLFSQAHQLSAALPELWINIAVLHARDGALLKAERALHQALQLDRANPAALSNLADLYRAQGASAKAAQVESRMQWFQNRNPYYFYQRALQALADNDEVLAERYLNDAIRIRHDEHLFHAARAQQRYRQGRRKEAEASLEQAIDLVAGQARIKTRYQQLLERWRSTSAN